MSRMRNLLEVGVLESRLPAMVWRDEFRTDVAAGAVNGTAAEPGPGTRTVQNDGGAYLSITGGKMVLSGGGAAYGTPILQYPAQTRQKGLSLWMSGKYNSGAIFNGAGWFTSAVGSARTAGIAEVSYSGGIGSNLDRPVVGTWTATKTLWIGTVMRGALGGYIFAKGEDYPQWTLLFVAKSVTAASPIATISNYSGVMSFDFIRCPAQLITVTPLASDSFNRADAGSLGSTDGVEAEESGGAGLAWTDRQGTWGISSNAAKASAVDGTNLWAVATVNSGSADALIEAAPTWSAGNVGIVLWWTDANNFVRVFFDGTNLQMIRRVAGVDQAPNINAAAGAGRLVVMIDGTKIRCNMNTVAIGTEQTIVDLSPTSVCGVFSSNVANTVDAFTVWNRKGGAYSAFDAFFRGEQP